MVFYEPKAKSTTIMKEDRNRLAQVFVSLLDNVVNFTKEDMSMEQGMIRLSLA
jgi:signal transduction histidine kinase